MISLISVIHDVKTNAVEATWVDADGVQVKCQSYADVQMAMFSADVQAFGGDLTAFDGDIAEFDSLIALVQSAVVLPDPQIELIATRTEKIAAIKAERDWRKFNGVKVGTQWLHTDVYSRTQWIGMFIMGANIPAVAWTTMDGTSVTISQSLAGAVFQGTAQLDVTLFNRAKALIAQVEAAADPASIDITTGWPLTFGESV